ncbi:MAG: hypothetical protein PHV37_01045 [Candidatus Gastranaerophilales bacterium]|nr:hypothetical protein [Candidatus Gastranaerophilales bacterium]
MVSLVAIITVVLYSYFVNHKIAYNLNLKIQNSNFIEKIFPTFLNLYKRLIITKKFSRIDVWNEIFDMPDSDYHWVLITDFEIKQRYEGWVSKFSDNVKENELFILDVIVYDLNDKELYRTPGLYMTRKIDNITIEFFKLTKTKHYDRYKNIKGEKMANEERNNSNHPRNNDRQIVENGNEGQRQTRIHDSQWITERGGSNPEPDNTPTERPHSNDN